MQHQQRQQSWSSWSPNIADTNHDSKQNHQLMSSHSELTVRAANCRFLYYKWSNDQTQIIKHHQSISDNPHQQHQTISELEVHAAKQHRGGPGWRFLNSSTHHQPTVSAIPHSPAQAQPSHFASHPSTAQYSTIHHQHISQASSQHQQYYQAIIYMSLPERSPTSNNTNNSSNPAQYTSTYSHWRFLSGN